MLYELLEKERIHGLWDSVSARKMHGCYYDMQKVWATFHSDPSGTRRSQYVNVNKPLQKVLKPVFIAHTFWNCMINQLSTTNDLSNICSKKKINFMNGLYLQCESPRGSWDSECTLHHWPRSLEMSDCTRPFQ